MLSSSHVYSLDVTVPTSITVHWSWCCHCSCTGIISHRFGIKGKESVNNEEVWVWKRYLQWWGEKVGPRAYWWLKGLEHFLKRYLCDQLSVWQNVNANKNWTLVAYYDKWWKCCDQAVGWDSGTLDIYKQLLLKKFFSNHASYPLPRAIYFSHFT